MKGFIMQAIDFAQELPPDYRRYRAGFPEDYFARVAQYGVGVATQALLDIGTGNRYAGTRLCPSRLPRHCAQTRPRR